MTDAGGQPSSPSRPKRFFRVVATVDDTDEATSFELLGRPASSEGPPNACDSTRGSIDSSPSSSFEEGHPQGDCLSFRYRWPLKLCRRRMGPSNSDCGVLHVSPAFCTAYNGVQFTWLLRMCDFEDLAELEAQLSSGGGGEDTLGKEPLGAEHSRRKRVNVALYYKEGPARDVTLRDVSISICNHGGERLFRDVPLEGLEYTKGSGGWAALESRADDAAAAAQRVRLSHFIHDSIGQHITVVVRLKMAGQWFQPLQYLPPLVGPPAAGAGAGERDAAFDSECWRLAQLHRHCSRVLEEIVDGRLRVPDLELLRADEGHTFRAHRLVFHFACGEVLRRARCMRKTSVPDEREVAVDPAIAAQVANLFAHLYFERVLAPDAECFEDFVAILDALVAVHFPEMKRELERHVCGEVMAESADLTFVKKTLLLAERFQLPILKMVSFGVTVDRLLAAPSAEASATAADAHAHGGLEESMDEMREELLQIAEHITAIEEDQHHGGADGKASKSGATGDDVDEGLDSDTFTPSHSSSPTLELEAPPPTTTTHRHGEREQLLVGSVIDQLEELALHIRKVSIQPGVSPGPVHAAAESPARCAVVDVRSTCASPMPPPLPLPLSLVAECSKKRRSSLRITRDFLNALSSTSPGASAVFGDGAQQHQRRCPSRSIRFDDEKLFADGDP